MSFEKQLDNLIKRSQFLDKQLMDPGALNAKEIAQYSKENAELLPIVEIAKNYKKTSDEISELIKISEDQSQTKEMRKMAIEELEFCKKKCTEMKQNLRLLLLPKDEDDEKGAILEIRAGTGGDEAALFAANLLRMYQKYAEKMNWKFEILSINSTGLDGCKEAVINITGQNVFSKLKFESGVHRVQRVPETESSGRIHTSAATIAVLPEAADVDIQIKDSDLRIDVFRASGAGGQHVNTTDSAVRITHIPTGTVVTQQDEKSQHKNKAKALKILRTRVYDAQKAAQDKELSNLRKIQVGSGDRSERIRTYNYSQNRVTDHRINLTLYDLTNIIEEGDLKELIENLTIEDQAAKLAEIYN